MDTEPKSPTAAAIKKALLLTFGERYVSTALTFAVTAAAARLLTPGDFGIIAVGISLQFAVASFQDFGISNYLLLSKEVKRETVRTGVAIIAVMSMLMTIALLVGANPLERRLGLHGLAPYMDILAIQTLVAAIGIAPMTLLRRDMRFDRIAVVNLLTTLSNASLTVALAYTGFGHMSYAYALLVSTVINVALVCAAHGDRRIFWPSGVGLRAIVAYGFWVGLADMLARGQDLLLNLIMGLRWQATMLGLFNRASTVATMPSKLLMTGIAPVAGAGFAALARSGGEMKHAYLKAVSYKACFLWPVVLLSVIIAHPIVLVLLGAQWLSAVPVLQVLLLAQLFTPPIAFGFVVLFAASAIRSAALVGTVSLALNVLGTFAATPYGMIAAATAMVAASAVNCTVVLLVTRRHVRFDWRDLSHALGKSAAVAAIAVAPATVVFATNGFDTKLTVLEGVVAAVLAAAGWLVGLRIVGHPLFADVVASVAMVKSRLQKQTAGIGALPGKA